MVSAATDVLHELCTFDSPSEHSECLSSLQLEEVVTFDHGPDAGLPMHERLIAEAEREKDRQRGIKSKGSVGFGDNKRTLFTGLAEMFPIKFTTDEVADYTMQLTFPDRVLRLRAETKTMFETWKALFTEKIPATRANIPHQGWLWRKIKGSWEQRYCIIHEGVLFFFQDNEACDKFKFIASRGNDAVFIGAPLSEGALAAPLSFILVARATRCILLADFCGPTRQHCDLKFPCVCPLSLFLFRALQRPLHWKTARPSIITCMRTRTLFSHSRSRTFRCSSACRRSTRHRPIHGCLPSAMRVNGMCSHVLSNDSLASHHACIVIVALTIVFNMFSCNPNTYV